MVDYVVLDTDIASDSFKGQLSPEWGRYLVGRLPMITFVTVAELLHWADLRGWGLRRRTALVDWLGRHPVIDSDYEVSENWARMSAAAVKRGRPRPVNDTWVAACCLAAELPLATRNTKDFADFAAHDGLQVIVPS